MESAHIMEYTGMTEAALSPPSVSVLIMVKSFLPLCVKWLVIDGKAGRPPIIIFCRGIC